LNHLSIYLLKSIEIFLVVGNEQKEFAGSFLSHPQLNTLICYVYCLTELSGSLKKVLDVGK